MPVDALELQIVSALQRFTRLEQSADNVRSESPGLATRVLTELETALEELRVAQDQLVENRSHLERLQTELTQQCGKYWELFELMPAAYVVTTPDSTITEANKAAAELFNVSQRFLIGKTLRVFVSEDRARILTEASRLSAQQGSAELTFRMRPRERAAVDVSARVSGDTRSLRWLIRTLPPSNGAHARPL